jgi:hypothetical protein
VGSIPTGGAIRSCPCRIMAQFVRLSIWKWRVRLPPGTPRLCSSMVKRSLGMGETESSILSSSSNLPLPVDQDAGFRPRSEKVQFLPVAPRFQLWIRTMGFYPVREGSIPSGDTNLPLLMDSSSGLRNLKRWFNSTQWHHGEVAQRQRQSAQTRSSEGSTPFFATNLEDDAHMGGRRF